MAKYSQINDQVAFTAALALCRGVYQRNLLYGREAISGATLTGTAKSYAGRYKQSAENLIARIDDAGIDIEVQVQDHNRRVIVIG